MAVVSGLQSVSVFDSSFLVESQSPASMQWVKHNRPTTRASSILQMWRELEGEHVASHPNARYGERLGCLGSETSDSENVSTKESVNGINSSENSISTENDNVGRCSQSGIELEHEHEDNNNFFSDQSIDLGEVERERVRQIFRKWMKNGAKGHSSSASHRNNRSRAQWLGENECERVRIIREWVKTNAHHSGSCSSSSDEGLSELSSQIAQVCDGQVVNQCEVAERRPIRKLCGRQALLDMLMKAQKEKEKELQDLSERKPVSEFAHRNRIQSLLRGRFLLNQRLIQDERPASMAASELGLLRQRQTVSDLREGFLSKLERSPVSDLQFDSNDDHRNQQCQSSTKPPVQGEVHNLSELSNVQKEFNGIDTVGNVKCDIDEDTNQQEHQASLIEAEEQVLEDEQQEQETSIIELVSSEHGRGRENNPDNWSQRISSSEETLRSHQLISCEHGRGDDAIGSWRENNPDKWSQQISSSEETLQSHQLGGQETYNENDAQSIVASDVHEADVHTNGFGGTMTEACEWHVMPTQAEEWQEPVTEHEEDDLQQFATHNISEWEVNEEGMDGSLQEGIANQWYQETLSNDVGVLNHLLESDGEWHENARLEVIDSWLDAPPGQAADSVGRVDSFDFLHEDNTRTMELRQLLSRRRVSTLLHSGFRESLDQLIQSYVQMQNNASVDWELDESSSFLGLDEEQQQHGNQDMGQPFWNQELQDSNRRNLNPQQHIGNEWEVISELRIDMARLHQRMNNMQRMLEACMDMQLELQRSVQQEVSAALNRQALLAECKDHFPMDDTKWDHVRKGICCVCFENNIDSLLYRCGHMCACSKCAEDLVQGGKCPMCWAPVVEVVHGYFLQ